MTTATLPDRQALGRLVGDVLAALDMPWEPPCLREFVDYSRGARDARKLVEAAGWTVEAFVAEVEARSDHKTVWMMGLAQLLDDEEA